MGEMNIEQIKQLIPHRYPFLLIDRVLDFQPGHWAKARKAVTVNEPFFQGHFPEQAVMPGVLILEALAQTGAVALLSEPGQAGRIALFGGIKNARFKTVVRPGDILELECQLTKRRGAVGFGEAVATVDGSIACRAELSFVLQDVVQDVLQDVVQDGQQGDVKASTRADQMREDAYGPVTGADVL